MRGSDITRPEGVKRFFPVRIDLILSSGCASVAPVCAKFAFDTSPSSLVASIAPDVARLTGLADRFVSEQRHSWVVTATDFVLRGFLVSATLLLNCFMMKFFVDALEKQNALDATVLNFALNFLFAGLLGHLVFGEVLSTTWMIGAIILLTSIQLISSCGTAGGNESSVPSGRAMELKARKGRQPRSQSPQQCHE